MAKTLSSEEIIFAKEQLEKIENELKKKITGQETVIKNLLVCLVAEGHALIEGMPGLAKTLIAKSLAGAIEVPFQRVQFTPDLLPADIIGNVVYNPLKAVFETRKGPIFTGIFLADEINRSPAKVQSALLQAMEEKIVTIADETYTLPRPFMVVATENPIEQEGTYQLPEAQMDRFLMKIMIDYPQREEEVDILKQHGTSVQESIQPVVKGEEIAAISRLAEKIHVEDRLREYIVNIVRYTRPTDGKNEITEYIGTGASPRASLAFLKSSRVNALLQGRDYVIPEDIIFSINEILRHRILLSFEALSENIKTDSIIETIKDCIPVP